MKTSKIILGLFIVLSLYLFAAQPIFSQTETLDIVQYTPPQGWAKTVKEGAVVYTDVNKTTNAFCILTVYASTTSAGSVQKDFANEWDRAVVKPFKAGANPNTQTQTTPEGWQVAVGGAQIELEGGFKAAAALTVFSGFDKTTSILVIFNDESYLALASALIDGIKLNKTKGLAQTAPPIQSNPSPTSQVDPFPDKPHVQPQKPLAGLLKASITMADLVGTWEIGGASVTTYVSSGNNTYTDATFFGKKYFIHSNGTYESKFQGRASNTTIRETDNGTIILDGGFITMKSRQNPAMRYQFVAFMNQSNGAAVLSLIYIGDTAPLDGNALSWNCGHPKGYVACLNGEEWVRIP